MDAARDVDTIYRQCLGRGWQLTVGAWAPVSGERSALAFDDVGRETGIGRRIDDAEFVAIIKASVRIAADDAAEDVFDTLPVRIGEGRASSSLVAAQMAVTAAEEVWHDWTESPHNLHVTESFFIREGVLGDIEW